LGIVIDVGESIAQKVQEDKFKESIRVMVSKFEEQRKEYLDFINDEENFIQKCFPDYAVLKNQLEELNAELKEKQLRHEQFRKWRQQGEAIEAEFSISAL
jgi:hypothetical protein